MAIQFKKVTHIYSPNTPFSYTALNEIDLSIAEGKVTAIIGATGSGKSTLVQHLNALLLPTSGEVEVCGKVINDKEKPKKLKSLRKEVGLVFQFPEYQLFEETIIKDVAFGPKNFGATEEEANTKAKQALQVVGITEDYYERSPLDLSGGQKRRVAIAGILAMDPSVVVLDEPTAGLDPQGAKQMMTLFKSLNTELVKTVLVVTHDMDHVLNYCDEVVVLIDGRVHCNSSVQDFFRDYDLMEKLEVVAPRVIQFRKELQEKGFTLSDDALTLDKIAEEVKAQVVSHE
ncbi:MAG: energy-coupling factor transporter ATPase [Anaerorhabdus sp.]